MSVTIIYILVIKYRQAGVTGSYRAVVLSSLMSPLSPTAGVGTYAGHSSRENNPALEGRTSLPPVLLCPSPTASYAGPSLIVS